MGGKTLACSLLLLFGASGSFAHQVQVGVLGVFHPREITLSAVDGEALIVTAGEREFVMDPGPRSATARIRVSQAGLLLEYRGRSIQAAELLVAGRDGRLANFLLTVPG